MFRISKTFSFSAAHALDHLEAGRQCANRHGHNYTVEVIMQASTLSSDSFVRDPIDWRRIAKFIRASLDRRDLNETFAAEFESTLSDYFKTTVPLHAHLDSERLELWLDDALRTTTENIARALFLRLRVDFPKIIAVRVGDTPETWAEYSND